MGVADRRVALVVQRVVRERALPDVGPAILVAPVGERVRLPQLVLLVPRELRRVRPGRRLVAPHTGDPRVEVEERARQRLALRDREIEIRLRLPETVLDRRALEHLALRVVAPLDVLPELVGLREEMVR